jgi:hypothetical protein
MIYEKGPWRRQAPGADDAEHYPTDAPSGAAIWIIVAMGMWIMIGLSLAIEYLG